MNGRNKDLVPEPGLEPGPPYGEGILSPFKNLVLAVGVEPTNPYGYRILSPVRMPVPPRQHVRILCLRSLAYRSVHA